MSWFNDAVNESAALRSRNECIEQGGEKIYNLLWGAIMKEQHESRTELLPSPGTTFDRILRHQALSSLHAEQNTIRTMHIKLSNDKTLITAKAPKLGQYGVSNVEFQLKPDEHGVLQLMHDNAPIEIRSAAIMVLRNFLFPELPLKGSSSSNT
jgi:hypothetical protein